MAITRVQSAIATGTSNNPLLSFGGSTTGNNLLVFALSTVVPYTITATGWTLAASLDTPYNPVYVYYKPQASTISGFGISLSGSAKWALWAAEYSITAASPLDQTNTGTSPGSPSTTPTMNTTIANEVLIYALGANDGTGTNNWSGPTNSFSIVNQANNTIQLSLCVVDRIVSSTGGYSTTVTDGNGGQATMVGVSFSDTGAAANTPYPRPLVFTVPLGSIPQLQF